MMLHVFAMLHEWFVDQLRAKVRREMADGFGRGKNLGPAAFGYTLVGATDPNGEIRRDDDGRLIREKVIAPEAAEQIREGFRRFAEANWSPGRIARTFNQAGVDGGMWTRRKVVKMLTRETYIGVEWYGMTYQVRDPETGRVEVKARPQDEWKRRDVPHLRIISDELWAKAQQRLSEIKAAHRKSAGGPADENPTRTSVYPTVLVRPDCGYCKSSLILGRSGKYASFFCGNGKDAKHGCQLTTYKSIRHVERSVVEVVRGRLVDPAFVTALTSAANAVLAADAARPVEDPDPVRTLIREVERKRDRLIALCERGAGTGGLDAVAAQIAGHEKRLRELRAQLHEIETRRPTPLPSLTEADVTHWLTDLHRLLAGDIAAAAPVLHALTGPVEVTQEKTPGKRGAVWVAKFALTVGLVLAQLGGPADCPTADTWEYLRTRDWTTAVPVEMRVDFVPRYAELAPCAKGMSDAGATLGGIAAALDIEYSLARDALRFATTGAKPKTKVAGTRTGTGGGIPWYVAHAAEVGRLRDDECLPFTTIAARFGVGEATVRRAYDHAHRADMEAAARAGKKPPRGRFVYVGMDVRRDIAARLARGERPADIAVAVECSVNTVYRVAAETAGGEQ
ncbi:hypothetical protein FRUB_07503 [Fimbriiglobus ruber]|uniref:Recombinase n=2 Tax=Fimbriiglobus ruber TaxID=1908690 RepID=A0A225DBM2_9BACT|nr:recombinase [Fimbriiglobus ruber]OWK38383.1 hypothetical protein FRUB_07503 [Fimbriiglobus ruber]